MAIRREKLTNALIKDLKPEAKEYTVWDSELQALGIRVRETGLKSFVLYYQGEKYSSKINLCKFPQYNINDAREIAKNRQEDLIKKKDPYLNRNKESSKITVSQLCDRYYEEYSKIYKKPCSIKSDAEIMKVRIKPELGEHLAQNLKTADVAAFHSKFKKTPYRTNRSLAFLSHMFNWAMQMEILEPMVNPCLYVKKYKEEKRERYLTNEEMEKLNEALNLAIKIPPIPENSIKAIKLLMLTGCRRNEILNLTWDEVDFEHNCLRLKDSKTGKKSVPVSDAALSIIKSIPKIENNPYVITGKFAEHLTCIKKSWDRVRQLAGIPELRIHDLRHNFASIGVCNNLSLEIIGRILGHRSTSTTQRYAHLQDNPVKNGVNQISNVLENFVDINSNAQH